jgi:hypothetical protein
MENELVAVQNVKDLQGTGKQWLEAVLGHHLKENQQVFVMVFTPGIEPDAAAKRKAIASIQRTWDRVDANLLDKGATGEDFDAAVDEAMEHIRRREA